MKRLFRIGLVGGTVLLGCQFIKYYRLNQGADLQTAAHQADSRTFEGAESKAKMSQAGGLKAHLKSLQHTDRLVVVMTPKTGAE